MENKHTPAPWYPIDIAGWQHIHSEPFYEATDLLNQEECENAQANIKVACAAPDLLDALQDGVALIEYIILALPTGKVRDAACNFNIIAQSAINKALS